MPESAVMRRLWTRMTEIYGHRWVSAYGDDSDAGAGLTWRQGLSGLTPEQVGRGVSACMASADSWPPTLPQFRAMCLGIPSLEAVRRQILEDPRGSGFARLVWSKIDGHRFRMADHRAVGAMLREAYESAREHVMRGGELPPAPAAEVEHKKPEHKPLDPEKAKARIQQIIGTMRRHHEN